MSIKLVATDYDGTFRVLPNQTAVNKRTAAKWRQRGNLFGFVTGRGTDFIEMMKKDGIGYDFLILYNGAIITDKDGKIIYESFLSDEAFKILEEECSKIPECEKYDRYREGVDKRLYYALFPTEQLTVKVAEELNRKYGDMLNAAANGRNLNVMTAGESKKNGIVNLCRLLNISTDEVAVIGDDYNDMDMLEYFKGYAVINAKPAVKKVTPHKVFSVSSMIKSFMK